MLGKSRSYTPASTRRSPASRAAPLDPGGDRKASRRGRGSFSAFPGSTYIIVCFLLALAWPTLGSRVATRLSPGGHAQNVSSFVHHVSETLNKHRGTDGPLWRFGAGRFRVRLSSASLHEKVAENPLPLARRASSGGGSSGSGSSEFTLRSACNSEMERYCQGQDNQVRCLLKISSLITSDWADDDKLAEGAYHFSLSCSEWFAAREACMTFLQTHSKSSLQLFSVDEHLGSEEKNHSTFWCSESDSARRCLRRAPPSLVPKACRNTGYYRATIAAGKILHKE